MNVATGLLRPQPTPATPFLVVALAICRNWSHVMESPVGIMTPAWSRRVLLANTM